MRWPRCRRGEAGGGTHRRYARYAHADGEEGRRNRAALSSRSKTTCCTARSRTSNGTRPANDCTGRTSLRIGRAGWQNDATAGLEMEADAGESKANEANPLLHFVIIDAQG